MRVAVVGGGIAGLVAARALAKAGHDVRVLESADRVGGVIRSDRREGFLLERGPNTVRPTTGLLALVDELGLADAMLLSDPGLPRYMAWKGSLIALPSTPRTLLTTPLLSAGGKLRLLAEPFVHRRGAGDSEETVGAFFTRRVGAQVAGRFVAPFVSGIFAGDPGRLSAEAAFPSLVRGEREHGSLLRWAISLSFRRAKSGPPGPRGLLSFREGLETLPRALAAFLGDRVETGVEVRSVRLENGRWSIETAAGPREADRVYLACPSGEAARLVRGFAPEAAAALEEIPQPPVAVLHLAWRTSALPGPLRGFGHLVIRSPGQRILGGVWSSSLFPGRAPEGWQLVTAFAGGTTDPAAAELSEGELLDHAAREITPLLRASESPRLVSVFRWPHAIPQYELGHPTRIEALARAEAASPGLRFLGAYRGGISVGDVVRNAAEADPQSPVAGGL